MHLLRHRLSSIPQLHNTVWGKKNDLSNMYRRLKRLRKLGQIAKRPILDNCDVTSTYELAPNGIKTALKNKGCIQKGQLSSQALLHDLNLVDIVQAIEKLNGCKRLWTETEVELESNGPEAELLKSPKQHSSDAYCIIDGTPSDIHCAIEYERTRKSISRSKERVHYYHEDPSVHWVLYITESEEDMHFLMDLDTKEFRAEDSKSHFCLRSNLLCPPEGKTTVFLSDYSEVYLH